MLDPAAPQSSFPSLGFYLVGIVLVLLGIAFILIPMLGSSGILSNTRIPWIVLYVYNKNGFYFATSPILLIVSLLSIVVFLARR
jgi:hypothetical protein